MSSTASARPRRPYTRGQGRCPRCGRETAEILAEPAALRGLAEAMESEQAGDVVYGVEAARRAAG